MSSQNNFTVNFTDKASSDLREILTYIRERLFNIKAVQDLISNIRNALDNISAFPFSSPRSEFIIDNFVIYKRLVDNYILFYVIDESEKEINIVRICYAERNFAEIFKDEE